MKLTITPKRRHERLLFVLCLTACLACGCGKRVNAPDPDANLYIVFDSTDVVRSVSIDQEGGAADETVQYADGTPFLAGETFSFSVAESASLPITVRIYAGTGQEMGDPLAEAEFTLDLSEGKNALLRIFNDADGALVIEHDGHLNFELSA